MQKATIITLILMLIGFLGVGYDADGGWLFNRGGRCKPHIAKPDEVPFPIDELFGPIVDDGVVPCVGPACQTPELTVASLDAKVARLEKIIETAGFTVVFEAGDEPDEPATTTHISLGGRLVIPAQRLRIRTVDHHGNSIGDPFTDVAPLGSPLKVRNVVR